MHTHHTTQNQSPATNTIHQHTTPYHDNTPLALQMNMKRAVSTFGPCEMFTCAENENQAFFSFGTLDSYCEWEYCMLYPPRTTQISWSYCAHFRTNKTFFNRIFESDRVEAKKSCCDAAFKCEICACTRAANRNYARLLQSQQLGTRVKLAFSPLVSSVVFGETALKMSRAMFFTSDNMRMMLLLPRRTDNDNQVSLNVFPSLVHVDMLFFNCGMHADWRG